MSNFYGAQPSNPPSYGAPPPPAVGAAAQNLQFYPSSYSPAVSGAATPQQAAYGYGAAAGAAGTQSGFASAGFGGAGVSGRMGEQGGLRTGWLAAFSTEGYDGEPPLLEELGVNFRHIQMKVCILRLRSRGVRVADLLRRRSPFSTPSSTSTNT